MKNFFSTLKRFGLLWLVLGIIVVLAGGAAVGEARRWWRLRGDVRTAEHELAETTSRVAELTGEIELVTDPEYLEKEARRSFNVKREGEEVFAVVGVEEIKREENFTLEETAKVESTSEMWENVKSWWRYFFR